MEMLKRTLDVIPEPGEETWGDRYVPETPEEESLLRALIGMALTERADWRPLLKLGAEPSEWEWRMALWSGGDTLYGQENGLFRGYIETRLTEFDPARALDGEIVNVNLWVEHYPSGVRVCWQMPENPLGHAQENYLPHLPVVTPTD